MKKFFALAAAVLLIALTAAPALAAPAAGAERPTVSVTGHAEIQVAPDAAIVTTGLATVADDVETARRQNDRIMQAVTDAMTAMGIAREKIRTSQFSLNPVYRPDSAGGATVITGYRLQNTVSVMVDDLEKVGAVVDAAFQAGANQFQGIQFKVKDERRLQDELLEKAVKDGRQKAGLMADALGESLGRVISVNQSGRVYPMFADNVQFAKSAGAGGTPVFGGLLTVSADVSLVFGLQ